MVFMKILLVNPSKINAKGQTVKFKKAILPPLNLGTLNSLTPKQHDVKIINDCVEPIDFDWPCDLVGITAFTSQANRAYQIADGFRSKGRKVVMGGVHPSMNINEAMAHADAVVVGEAENIWEQLLVDCENNQLKAIYRDAVGFDMQRLIVPSWEGSNLNIYHRSVGRKMPRMPIYTTRGCVHNCKYCSVSKFFGRTYRFKPIDNVLKEIDAIGAESYFLVDDNIVCRPAYTEALFKSIRKKNIWWFSQSSVQLVRRPHLIELASQSGCKGLLLGVESLSPKTLKGIKKSWNKPDMYKELIQRLIAAKIRPWVSIMVGLDDDDEESLTHTVDLLMKWGVYCIVFSLLTPLPGTELYDDLDNQGRIIVRDWGQYDCNHVVIQPKNFTPDKLYAFYRRAFLNQFNLNALLKYTKLSIKTGYHPVRDLVNAILFYTQLRKKIAAQDHPFSMGVGLLN